MHEPLPSWLYEIEELRPQHALGYVRLPELVGVPFTPRVKALVDHPHMQRLRKVRQLSLAYLVYPGAVHTRFEHSLGVFQTMTNYVTALAGCGRLHTLPTPLTKGDIEAILVAALLHDIGHFPFAHLMEGLFAEVPDHVEWVAPMLDGSLGLRFPALALPADVPTLGDLLAREWPDVDPRAVFHYIAGSHVPDPAFAADPKHALLRSLLDGPVDADKMDYLYRDSLHAGVPYGRFIDRDRFFQALTIAPDAPSLAFSEKGRIGVELFAYARSAMYSEVYWHHSSRAVTAMLNRAFRAAIEAGVFATADDLLGLAFSLSDEACVEWLAAHGGAAAGEITRLLGERRLYKRLLVLQKPSHPTLFAMLERLKFEAKRPIAQLETLFIARLNEASWMREWLGRPLRAHELLIDIPQRTGGLPPVRLLREGRMEPVADLNEPGVWNGIHHDFENWVRKIRVFVHPDVQAALVAATGGKRADGLLHERLLNALTECTWSALGLR